MGEKSLSPISPIKNFIAGGVGGSWLVFSGHPLDTLKVRLQATSQYKGTLDCIVKTYKNEGIFGFYRGLTPPLAMVTPLFATAFFGFGMGKKFVLENRKDKSTKPLTATELFLAGSFSGSLSSFLACPVERIKCILQVQQGQKSTARFKGPIDCGKTLLKEGGISSLYKGLIATYIRTVPQAGIYFMTYELLKRKFASPEMNLGTGPLMTILAGGLAGVINWAIVLPTDVIKSRVQADLDGKVKGFRHAAILLARENGIRGFYKGLMPVMIRSFPANGCCFLGFECTIKFLNYSMPDL